MAGVLGTLVEASKCDRLTEHNCHRGRAEVVQHVARDTHHHCDRECGAKSRGDPCGWLQLVHLLAEQRAAASSGLRPYLGTY